MDSSTTFWLPTKASTFAEIVDPFFYVMMWISLVFLIATTFTMVYFVVKYRRKRPDQLAEAQITHNFHLELWWSVIPLVIVMGLFYFGLKGYLEMHIEPNDAMEIRVRGQKWSWSFTYPEGAETDTLVVPVARAVKLTMNSIDVLHSFFIPAFRVKQDLIPNRYTSVWFKATTTGTFPIWCAEYCGTSHSDMITAVKVLTPENYQTWLKGAADPGKGLSPVEFGKTLFTKKGCNACHSVDGANQIGPTWKGAFGTNKVMASGKSVLVDENYIRNSIFNPQQDIVAGFQPVMPTYKGIVSDLEVDALIAFFKSLK